LFDGTILNKTVFKLRPFIHWVAIKRLPRFFSPREGNHIDVIVHFFMNRLRQQYSEVMKMDVTTRDNIFKLEQQVIEKEKEANKKK
jgi:hypothetical protein